MVSLWFVVCLFACLAVVNFFPDLLSQQVCYVEKLLSLPVNFVYYHLRVFIIFTSLVMESLGCLKYKMVFK